MSLERVLSTQERVDLAVTVGHKDAVLEYIRMHDRKGEGSGQLSVHTSPGNTIHFVHLPDYAFAAVDCYLTSLGVVLYVTVKDVGRVAPKPTFLTTEHLKYANHCHEQAAYFGDMEGMTYSGRLKQDAEFAAAHTAFSMIEDSIKAHPFDVHGNEILIDLQTGVHTLRLANGRMVCREPGSGEKGADAYSYYKHETCDSHLSVDDILNHELNELVDTLYNKGYSL